MPGCLTHGLWTRGRGQSNAHAYIHSHATHHTRLQSRRAQEQTRSTHTQKCAPTNTYFTRPPTSHHKHRRTRTHTPLPLMHAHHTQARNTRATDAHAHVHIYAHTLTSRAHTLRRTHTPPCTGTHRAHTLTPRAHAPWRTHRPRRAHAHAARAGRGGSGRWCPAPRGQERARCGVPRAVPELFAGAGTGTGRRWLGASPGPAALGWAARSERVPGHAGAREWSAAGSAPWTPRRAAARMMTVWTREPRPAGELGQAGA